MHLRRCGVCHTLAPARQGAACAVCNILKCQQLSGARNFLYSGAEYCESAAPGPRFPLIPPQGPPPGRRALRRTAAPGKKSDGVATGSIASSETRNTARFPRNTLFLGSCPTSGAWRWFSKRYRTRRCRRGSGSGAGADATIIRFVWRATIAVLQHERSLVREINRNPAHVVRIQPAGLPGQAEGQDRQRGQAGCLRNPADGELQLLPVESP